MPDEFKPTDEQAAAVELAKSGKAMAVEALAGTGKTSTLGLIAEAKPSSGLYVAFNKSIVEDAASKFPHHVDCRTAHSLAFREVGIRYKHRLNGQRMKSSQIARMLDIEPIQIATKFGSKRLAPGFLAGIVMRGIRRFCTTADENPAHRHIPTPDTMRLDPGLLEMWRDVQHELEPVLEDAWVDVVALDGVLPFEHNAYLKIWQLEGPRISTDYILFDECQDANPLMLAIVEAQRDHAQLIFVGDRHQAIYSWNGSVNAMEQAPVEVRSYLTNSFRFGPEIAQQANDILSQLGEVEVAGLGPDGRVGAISHPNIVLSRTNTAAVRRAFTAVDEGRRPHIIGGASEIVGFARGCKSLMDAGWSSHPELACFNSWGEVQEYVRQDELGRDLSLMVSLIVDFGAERIINGFDRQPRERDADLILSTAHKAKGREWDAVQLADDFPSDAETSSIEERRLLYVAATRAKTELDVTRVGILNPVATGPKEDLG